jgi:hypothetical protein
MNTALTQLTTLLTDLKERQREANRQYYYRNRHNRAEYHKQWYEANKERLREHYRLKAQERRHGTADTAMAIVDPDITE